MAHLNLFNAPGYQHTYSLIDPSEFGHADNIRIVSVEAHGVVVGYRARGYGKYQAVAEGPMRATVDEAYDDAHNRHRILWHVVGYLCG